MIGDVIVVYTIAGEDAFIKIKKTAIDEFDKFMDRIYGHAYMRLRVIEEF